MNILVTGGASGLGKAITHKLAEDSTNFVNFTYCKSENDARQIEASFKNSRAYKCDFTATESVDAFVEKIKPMDLGALVNNAITGMIKKHFHKMTAGEFDLSFRSNILPVIKITQRAIETFKNKKSGKIITILSTATLNTPPAGWSEYTANKAYLHSLSMSWSKEYAKFNIASNCISPSFMLTGLNNDTDERIIEEMKSKSPTGELLRVEEVASVVSFFLSDEARHLNGSNLILSPGKDVI